MGAEPRLLLGGLTHLPLPWNLSSFRICRGWPAPAMS